MSISKKIDLQELACLIDEWQELPEPELTIDEEPVTPADRVMLQALQRQRKELVRYLAAHGIMRDTEFPSADNLRLNEREYRALVAICRGIWSAPRSELILHGLYELFEVSEYESKGSKRIAEKVRALAGQQPEPDEYYHEDTGSTLNKVSSSVARSRFGEVTLTDREFQLIEHIAKYPNSSAREIAEQLWPNSSNPRGSFDSTLTNANKKLKPLKIRAESGHPRYKLVKIGHTTKKR